MDREKALKQIRNWSLPKETREVLETLIPELRESEDERIRKGLIKLVKDTLPIATGTDRDVLLAWLEKQEGFLKDGVGHYFYDGNTTHFISAPAMEERAKVEKTCKENPDSFTDKSEDKRIIQNLIDAFTEYKKSGGIDFHGIEINTLIAYLEKQKYDRMKPIYDAKESFESALEKAWNDYHNGYENVDKLEDDYVECAHAKGFREGFLYGLEKQKENNEYVFRPLAGIDITIAAEQAIRRAMEGDHLVLAFNGVYLPVREYNSAKELVDEYYAHLEKQKEKSEIPINVSVCGRR